MCDVTSPAEIVLPLDPEAAARSREFLRTSICSTHHALVIQDAELLVSELVTNGVRYAAPPIVLRVECENADSLRVLVRDGSPKLPHVNHAEPEDERGRGLFLVDYISDEWGAETTSEGKVTWFRLHG
jgi:anti-sigma regulatory factor (Ser/Thr protein kinase)